MEVIKSISAENTFSDPITVGCGYFKIYIWGSSFSATVSLQTTPDDGVTWITAKTYTGKSVDVGLDPTGGKYRLGIETGNYTSGTVNVKINS
jgi:hypothetical protein